ncbi:MAG: N-acetylmuramoyl-L-alanine amidase, partial [Deltaproteobacteria bacterium]|nr:N-acetylmuramoyl-L-alanine amidase [Deltaproteobacteria bacterium]
MRKISRAVFLLTLLVMSTFCTEAFASVDILNVRHWTAPDHTRVVLDLTGETPFKVVQEDRKVYVDLQGAALNEEIPPIYDINKPAVEKVLLVSLPDGGTRVEIWVPENVRANVFKLGIILDKPHRVVIDVMLPDVEKKESEEREKVKVLKKKVVVIDPGHGGEDPGAIGRRGTREKTVVLRIAKKLQRILKVRGYEAFLTRKGDYYISLKNRGKIAREYGADIFLSIHADACRSRGARGTSVYCLSTGGASSEAAKLLAQNENLSDIIGGSENGNGNGASDPIALNMLQTETINRSRAFGKVALNKIKKVNHVRTSRVQEAPFRVLKLPDITSLLIETAYISNPREELMLRSSSGQTDMAWAIAYAVDEFL